MTPFIGGDDDIIDDDDETPLDEDGDGDGVNGVGEPRVSEVAEIFLAVNESGMLTTPLMVVGLLTGLPCELLLRPRGELSTELVSDLISDLICCSNILGEMGDVVAVVGVVVMTQEEPQYEFVIF